MEIILQYYVRSWRDLYQFGLICQNCRKISKESQTWFSADLSFRAPLAYVTHFTELLLFHYRERYIGSRTYTLTLPQIPDEPLCYASFAVKVTLSPSLLTLDKLPTKEQILIVSGGFRDALQEFSEYWRFYAVWWRRLTELLQVVYDLYEKKKLPLQAFYFASLVFVAEIIIAIFLRGEYSKWLVQFAVGLGYPPLLFYLLVNFVLIIMHFSNLLIQRTETSFFPYFKIVDLSGYSFWVVLIGCCFLLLILIQIKISNPDDSSLSWLIITLPIWLAYLLSALLIGLSAPRESAGKYLMIIAALLLSAPLPLTISIVAYSYDHSIPLNDTIYKYFIYILYIYGTILTIYSFFSSILAILALQSIEWPNTRWRATVAIALSGLGLSTSYWFLVSYTWESISSVWMVVIIFLASLHTNFGVISFE